MEKIYPLSVNSVVEMRQIRSTSTTSLTETLAQRHIHVEDPIHSASYILKTCNFP